MSRPAENPEEEVPRGEERGGQCIRLKYAGIPQSEAFDAENISPHSVFRINLEPLSPKIIFLPIIFLLLFFPSFEVGKSFVFLNVEISVSDLQCQSSRGPGNFGQE